MGAGRTGGLIAQDLQVDDKLMGTVSKESRKRLNATCRPSVRQQGQLALCCCCRCETFLCLHDGHRILYTTSTYNGPLAVCKYI